MPFRWEIYEVEEERTLKELKEKYGDASAKKQTREQMLENAGNQYVDIWDKTAKQMNTARDCVNLLRTIAARAAPLSEGDYVAMQIDGEKSRAEPGWQDRVRFLEEILERANMVKAIVEGTEGSIMPSPKLPASSQSPQSQNWYQRLKQSLARK
jgi:hypothetical protein